MSKQDRDAFLVWWDTMAVALRWTIIVIVVSTLVAALATRMGWLGE